MTRVVAGITISVDGSGPNDGPGKGLGEGGERLHSWVFGGPWRYGAEGRGEATAEDAAWLDAVMKRLGVMGGGRHSSITGSGSPTPTLPMNGEGYLVTAGTERPFT